MARRKIVFRWMMQTNRGVQFREGLRTKAAQSGTYVNYTKIFMAALMLALKEAERNP